MKSYKNSILTLFIFFHVLGYSQDVFEYEKKITDNEKYNFEEINLQQTEENIKLSGTLVSPKTKFDKVVIIIPGSGKDTRNSHFVLTEELLKNNIAVFRYDERGVGKSEGEYNTVTYSISKKVNDVFSVIDYIKNLSSLENKKIGIIAHSEGGLASIGAIEKGITVDFLIQWATPIEKHGAFLKYQLKTGINLQERNLKFSDLETKLEIMAVIHLIIEKNKNESDEALRKKIKFSLNEKGIKKKQFEWYISFPASLDLLRKNFEETYKNLNTPMLYIIGSEDKFVDPISNINLLKNFNNNKIEIKCINGLNHYLTHGELKGMNSHLYEMDIQALSEITTWIKNI